MKLTGLLLIVILSTTLGASLYDKDRKKLRTFSLLVALVDEMYTEIRYTGSTVEEILLRCANNPIYKSLVFLEQIKRKKAPLSPSILREAIKENTAALNFDSDEILPLLNMADRLGTTDIMGQLQMLEACKLQLLEFRSMHNKRCNTLGKMYISLGLLLGIGTAVILA